MFVNMNFRKKFTTLFYRNQKALEKKTFTSIDKIIRNVYDVAHSEYSPSMAEKFPQEIF